MHTLQVPSPPPHVVLVCSVGQSWGDRLQLRQTKDFLLVKMSHNC